MPSTAQVQQLEQLVSLNDKLFRKDETETHAVPVGVPVIIPVDARDSSYEKAFEKNLPGYTPASANAYVIGKRVADDFHREFVAREFFVPVQFYRI